jgi:hypothetical protein
LKVALGDPLTAKKTGPAAVSPSSVYFHGDVLRILKPHPTAGFKEVIYLYNDFSGLQQIFLTFGFRVEKIKCDAVSNE